MKSLLPSALLLLGCVTTNPDRALHQRASEHVVYRRPITQLWPEATAFLVERGYAVPAKQAGTTLATDWRQEPSRRGALRTRYVVEWAPVDGGATLHFFLEEEVSPFQASGVYREVDFERRPDISELGMYTSSRRVDPAVRRNRDLAAEWEFVERVAPRTAEQIRADVAASQQAR